MDDNSKTILNLLLTKSALKQDISEDTQIAFGQYKSEVRAILQELKTEVKDDRIRLNFIEKSDNEFHVYIGSDVLVFQMHTNVFRLPDGHPLWDIDYLKKKDQNGFFGMIHIYNFLAESFIQNRYNDAGYLIGRMFVNHDEHFFVEGKGQLGFLFKDPTDNKITKESIRHILQVSFSFALDFDLFMPPYEVMQELSVEQVQMLGSSLSTATGKRVGFKFSTE